MKLGRFRHFNRNKRVFIRFLISYLVVLLIPILFSSFVYREAVHMVEKDALEKNLALLEQSRDMLEIRLGEIETLTNQLALNAKITELMYYSGPVEGKKIYDLWDTWKNLAVYRITNHFINNFYIFLQNSEIVLHPDNVYRLPVFYDQIFKIKDMEYEQWRDEFLIRPHHADFFPASQVVENGVEKSMIAYAKSIPIGASSQPLGTIMILIDEQELHRYLKRIASIGEGYAYIADEHGQILSAYTNGQTLIKQLAGLPSGKGYALKDDMLVSYTTSSYNGWSYVAVIPSRTVMLGVDRIKKIIEIVLAGCLVAGIPAAYLMAYWNFRPIWTWMKMLKERFGGVFPDARNEYDYLNNAITRILSEEQELKQTYEKQIPLLQDVFLKKLLSGEFDFDEEAHIISQMSQIRLDLTGRKFMVLLARIYGSKTLIREEEMLEMSLIKTLIVQAVTNQFTRCVPVDTNDDRIAFIMHFEYDNNEPCVKEVESLVQDVKNAAYRHFQIRMNFAAGNIFDRLLDLSVSFRDAQAALDYGLLTYAADVLWAWEVPRRSESYYYPLDIEQRLVHNLKAGNDQESLKIIDAIYHENFVKRTISYEMAAFLLSEMKGSIIKSMFQFSTDEDAIFQTRIHSTLDAIGHGVKVTEAIDAFREICMEICNAVTDRKTGYNRQLNENFIDYINSRYSSQELSLAGMASYFKQSEASLSHMFKEQVGQNYSSYVEKVRMEKAVELLAVGRMAIEQIADQTGYNSPHAFRRAFKRYYGISPSDYKSSIDYGDHSSRKQ